MSRTPSAAHLKRIEAKFRETRAADRSLWTLVESVHSTSGLRESVTLESRPLCPVIERPAGGREALIHVLLAVPNGAEGFQRPWACVSWGWPSRRVRGFSEVADRLGRVDPLLTANHRCSREFADAAEAALARGGSPPMPPAPIPILVQRALGRGVGTVAPAASRYPPDTGVGELHSDSIVDLRPKLEQLLKLLRELGSAELEREWRRIYGRLGAGPFSVVVVGERGRGKSALINRLLGEELLPVGLSDRRPLIVEIVAADEPSLEVVALGGEGRRVPLTRENLTGADAVGGLLRARVANSWLTEAGIRITELPASDGLDGAGLEQVIDCLASAEAVLVAVNATMALALTEKAFVEKHVLARRAPRVAVVLTHLDKVEEAERGEVLEFVRRQVARWADGIPVCIPQPPSLVPAAFGAGIVAGEEELRRLLTSWAGSHERGALARRQVIANTLHLLDLARTQLEARREAAGLAEQERCRRLADAERLLESQGLDWDELRLETERRQARACEQLSDELRERRDRMLDDLALQLSQSSQPKIWWEENLPHELRRRLEGAERALEGSLKDRFRGDARWLVDEASRRFSSHIKTGGEKPFVKLSAEVTRASDGMADPRRMKTFVRGGYIVAASAGWLMNLGAILSLSAVFAGELIVAKVLASQRDRLAAALPEAIDTLVSAGRAAAFERLRDAYGGLVATVRSEQESWLRMQRQTLQVQGSSAELAELGRSLAAVDRLAAELRSLGEEGSHDCR